MATTAAEIVRMKEAGRGFRPAIRVNNGLLGKLEKRTLIWIAERLPGWVNSDHLTVLGLMGMIAAGGCYALSGERGGMLLAVDLCLAVNWFGDSLDGTLARVRNRQRPRYGFYVDHVVDIFGALALLGGMALSGRMSPLVAAGVLTAFLFLSIESYLATYTIGEFHLSFGGFGPTELRLLLAIGNLFLIHFRMGHVLGRPVLVLDIGAVCAITAMGVMMLIAVLRHTALLYGQERLG
ncbi:MAG TPA: CDP-alcohol phosphatidyltransferase family protein [Candidatus Koribacter sp.]